jgi:DIM1 family U5 snRNP protein
MSEEERLVIIRFGRDWDPDCMRQDEVLYRKKPLHPLLLVALADPTSIQASPIVSKTSPLSTSAISTKYPTSNRCTLYDPVTLMFSFRNKHMMCDFGTVNNNKLN